MGQLAGRTLFWHRRDLRTTDNVGLEKAGRVGTVLPVYVLDPELLSLAGEDRTRFFLDSVSSLQETYRRAGTDLLVRRGDPDRIVPELAAEFGADSVAWNQDHSTFSTRRDRAITHALEDAGCTVEETADMALHEPGSILTSAGDHYSVFSYFYRKWADRPVPDPVTPPPPDQFAPVEGPEVSTVAEVDPSVDPPLAPGRDAAVDRLQTFLDGPIFDYDALRDRPAASGTSRLSQDLKFGLLGIREVFGATMAAADDAVDEDSRAGVEAYQRQLAWRDFYVQVLAAHPETVRENVTSYEHPIAWRTDPEGFDAWKRGRTGFPIVDAGMRQLQTDAYIHNRVRMIVASFLTKDLQIDWRRGYEWFRERLIDHETANDVGGWQWAASTGTDPQPYFRIFNPMTQGKRHDPDAEYIRRYLPSLRGVEPDAIHEWPDLSTAQRSALAPEYPDPILDHASRRETAIDMFERARGTD